MLGEWPLGAQRDAIPPPVRAPSRGPDKVGIRFGELLSFHRHTDPMVPSEPVLLHA